MIDFVWNGKKHEISKELLCASLENRGLGLTKITNKIFAQRIVWLSKLYNMDQNCFTKVIAEEHIGNFDTEYKGLDFLKGDLHLRKVQSSDDFYLTFYKSAKNSNLNMKSETKNSKRANSFFLTPEFLMVMVTYTNQLKNLLELGFLSKRPHFQDKAKEL